MIRFKKYLLTFSGETASNKTGVLQGQLNTPLNDLGIEQAKLAGSRLKATKFDSVFASDLKRVLQTTSGILKENDSLKGTPFYRKNESRSQIK